MKPRRLFLLLIALAASSTAHASGAQETALQRRYAEVRSRIEALFQHRDTPPPAISIEDNPFIVGSTALATAAPVAPGTAPTRTAAPAAPTFTKLQLIAATLRITGLVRMGTNSQLVVNAAPRKAGDLISVMWQGSPVFVRLVRFEPGLATFSLDGENVTLRY